VTTPPLDAWLASRRDAVDAALERFLPQTSRAPAVVIEAMRYSIFAGGKRLRPVLALAAAEAVALNRGEDAEAAVMLALPAACAVEMIHTYSLVHDDLPAMDNDTLRRGRPTSHVVHGEGMAILAGDALLTDAFALLAREPAVTRAALPAEGELARRKLATIQLIAEAAGSDGMVGGQALDLRAAEPGAPALEEAGLHEMHARKTGALLRASAVAGATMAGATSAVRNAVSEYGTHIGLAFQIIDDILDVEGASVVLGKTSGKDAAAGKPTYPSMYGLDESRRRAESSLRQALRALNSAALGGQLPAIAEWVVARRN
jgi:geranylgeranyl diphosphate synthase type II